MAVTDLDCVILKVNRAFSVLTGYSADEVVGHHIRLLKSGLNDAAFYAAMWEAIRSQGVWQGEIWNRRKGGELYAQWLTITTLRGKDGKPSHYIGTQTDITDRINQRQRMELDLAAFSTRLKLATRQLLAVQEETRHRLAGELHDRTKPNLAAIDINLSVIEAQLGNSIPQLVEALADTRALVEDTEASIRDICAELRPAVPHYSNLQEALEGYSVQFRRRTGIPVRFTCDYTAGNLSPQVQSVLFRAFQEAVTNAAKHADPKAIDVVLTGRSGQVSLSIADDGCGFDASKLDQPEHSLPHGLGLLNMREMAALYNGNVVIHSAPGHGTRITIEIQEPTQ